MDAQVKVFSDITLLFLFSVMEFLAASLHAVLLPGCLDVIAERIFAIISYNTACCNRRARDAAPLSIPHMAEGLPHSEINCCHV